MKEEEFNDFLRNRADSFELKPSSGSFDEVARKLSKKKKRRGIIFFILPLVLLAGISTGYYLSDVDGSNITAVNNNKNVVAEKQPTISTPLSSNPSITANVEENNEVNVIDNGDLQIASSVQQNRDIQTTSSVTSNSKQKKVMPVAGKNFVVDKTVSTKYTDAKTENFGEEANTDNKEGNTTPTINSDVTTNNATNNIVKAETITEDNKVTACSTSSEAKKELLNPVIKPGLDDCHFCGCLAKRWTLRAFYNPFGMSYFKDNISATGNEDESISASIPPRTPFTYEREFMSENLKGKANFGINLEYRLTKRLRIGAGIGFSRWRSEIGEWTVIYNKNIVNVYSVDTPSNIVGTEEVFNKFIKDSSSYTNDVSSIQIPLYFNLSLLQKPRFSLDARIGVVANYIQNVTTLATPKPLVRATNTAAKYKEYYRNFNVNFSTGIFANYTIGKCWGIYAGPRFGAAITSIHNNENFEYSRPYNWGIETGIKIKF